MKKMFSILLLAALVFSLGVCAMPQSAMAEATVSGAGNDDVSAQLNLIYSNLDGMKQSDGQLRWYYSVMDLNHDGNLEFVAAAQHPADRSTNLKVWEVKPDRSGFTEYTLDKDPEESFPDILTDSTDTFYDTATDTWSYMCYDNVVLSPTEVYTVKCSVNVKDGKIGYDTYAVEHTEITNGIRTVDHTDENGFNISAEQYNAAGVNAFAGTERSSTSFDWFTQEKANSVERLTDSYLVFAGEKEPVESFPVPKPAALQEQQTVPTPDPNAVPIAVVPASTPAPAPKPAAPIYLSVTKNPTNENNRKVGGTANFVSCANTFESLTWTFVAPDWGEYSVAGFRSMFPGSSVSGEYSTTLTVGNVQAGMNGWGAYCTFYYQGQTARTTTAYMYVNGGSTPAPAPAQDVYGSMSGTAYHDTAFTIYVVLQNGTGLHLNGNLVNIIGGNDIEGASCVVYYVNSPTEANIYRIDVYGREVYVPDTTITYVPDTTTVYSTLDTELSYDVYNGDGSTTTYYWDGATYTDYADGSFMYDDGYGSATYYAADGSYGTFNADGSWEAYDASTDSYSGGIIYD